VLCTLVAIGKSDGGHLVPMALGAWLLDIIKITITRNVPAAQARLRSRPGKLDEALKRKRKSKDNLFKAYALIWERCAKAMQNKLLAQSEFEDEN